MNELTPILSEKRLTWLDKVKAVWCFEKWWEKAIIIFALTYSIASGVIYLFNLF